VVVVGVVVVARLVGFEKGLRVIATAAFLDTGITLRSFAIVDTGDTVVVFLLIPLRVGRISTTPGVVADVVVVRIEVLRADAAGILVPRPRTTTRVLFLRWKIGAGLST
jgi:hypothetical protein